MKNLLTKFPALLLALVVGILASPAVFAGSTIVIENGDSGTTGFNDPTPASPVGGNSGTTLGQQRLIAFQTAANIWGATLNSGPTITVHATWSHLTCTSTTAVLGSASRNGSIWRNLPGLAFSDTWYGAALANAIVGRDLETGNSEIVANFNIDLGNTGCLDGSHWYLGLDSNHGNDVDLVAVLIHELAHGLGFQTFTNASTGAQSGGLPSVFDRFLRDNSTGKTWDQMTDAERAASAINTNNLVWIGPQVTTDAHSVLGNPRLKVNSPVALAGNYLVGTADFGPSLTAQGITANVVQALDPADSAGATTTDGCSALTNPGAIAGKIALIDRGTCTFVTKVKNAQAAGAVGVVIADNAAGTPPPGLGGSDSTITIPAVRITQADGVTLKAQLALGVNATLGVDTSTPAGADSLWHPQLYTPNPFVSGSSVSHWDTSAFPNQLMEPNISGDLTHTVTLPKDLTASLLKDIGWSTTAAAPSVQFAQASYSVGEAAGNVAVTVNRTDTTTAANVDYATSDPSGLTACNQVTGNASSRCDYATTVGTLRFAAGESTKTIFIPIVDDGYVEGPESFSVTLSNPVGMGLGTNSTATITITDNDATTSNPIVGVPFFVRQQYIDFLGREPDDGGFAGWQKILNTCAAGDNSCDRIAVSSGFFRSPEFQDRGSFIFRFYSASLGRNPLYSEFMPDLAKVSGFLTDAQLEANKVAFVQEFMTRTEFVNKYGGLSNAAFVDKLIQTSGLTSHPLRDAWVGLLNSNGATRAEVLRAFTESLEVYNKFYNQSFVVMQYFGYLRRDPDASYTTWIDTLTRTGDFRGMISGFMNANEYVLRFGP